MDFNLNLGCIDEGNLSEISCALIQLTTIMATCISRSDRASKGDCCVSDKYELASCSAMSALKYLPPCITLLIARTISVTGAPLVI